jgi:transcription elongation factor GreA
MSDQTMPDVPVVPAATEPIEITAESRKQLEAELSQLTTIQRPDLVRRERRARLFLDPGLSQTAAAVARIDLDVLDGRINQLTDVLERAKVIPDPTDNRTVQVGSRVSVRYDDDTGETLTIVGPYGADPSKGYVASDSPAGKALLGKAAGDKVTAGTGEDSLVLTVVSIGDQDAPDSLDVPAI